MKKTIQQDDLELSEDYFRSLYIQHFQGALVRIGASTFMWLFALLSYLVKETQINHFTGVSLSVLYLICINPPTLLILKRLKSKRAFKYVSLSINILEILGYTAVIYSLGGVEATFLTPIYTALIVYVGVLGPRNYPYFIASLCSVAFSLVVLGEYFGFLSPQHVVASFSAPWLTIITRLSVVIGLLFVVAYISVLTSNILNKNKKKLHVQNIELLAKTALLEKAEKGLRASHQELEKRIEERTQELRIANDQLIVDIDERKKAEEALLESEEKYRLVIENATDAIFITQDERFKFANPKTKKMTEYSGEELAKIPFVDIIHPEDRNMVLERHLKRLKGEELPRIYSFRILNKSGEELSVDINIVLISWEGAPATLNFLRDITEQKKLESQLQQAQKMEAIGLMAGGVAHDLNNILSGIVSYPELLLMDLPANSPLRKPIETIKESGMKAADVVADLLTIARGVAMRKEVLNLNTIVNEYLSSAEHHRLEKMHSAINFKTELDPNLLNMSGSASHIRKTLMNLVINAWEAVEGGGRVTISTTNRYLDEPLKGYENVRIGEYVVLTVSDDGSGISTEDLEKIFEPFFTKKVMGRSGTGLGLAVVWNTVQVHNGYVNVRSGGTGTEFELYFPLTRDEMTAKKEALPLEEYLGHGEKVLVVDDEERQREIACAMLNKLGYNPEAVSSGEDAIEYVKAHHVALIVLDMVMPKGINGRKTYEEIIKIRPGQKAIIASGYAKTKEMASAQELGAGSYIKKPYTLGKIGLAVKEELENQTDFSLNRTNYFHKREPLT